MADELLGVTTTRGGPWPMAHAFEHAARGCGARRGTTRTGRPRTARALGTPPWPVMISCGRDPGRDAFDTVPATARPASPPATCV